MKQYNRKNSGELVGPKFCEPLASLICIAGLNPSEAELMAFLEAEGMSDYGDLFKWALCELRKESQPLSKQDSESELFKNLESIANFNLSAIENVKPGDLFKFFKSKETYLEIEEVTDDKVVGILKSECLPEGHRVEYSKADFLLWWMSGFFDRMATFQESEDTPKP